MDQREIDATVDAQNMDYINQLPDCILESILSLLVIKDAVHTSMLSRRWRHLWLDPILRTKRNLEFDFLNIFGSKRVGPKFLSMDDDWFSRLKDRFNRQVFVSRVNSFLQLYHGEKIDSFKVAFFLGEESSAILDEWIRYATAKGVEVLHLHLFPPTRDREYVFPCWLLSELNASSLKCFSLRGCILKSPPDFEKFSQLTTLRLSSVVIYKTFLEQLFCVCLLLESLTLKDCTVPERDLIVPGPALHLKDLKVIRCLYLFAIEIYAVNLASVEYIGDVSSLFSIKAPQLTRFSNPQRGRYMLPDVLTLFSSYPELETLHAQLIWPIPECAATLRNLKQLSVDIHCWERKRDIDLECVLNVLKATPILEELTVRGPLSYENERQKEYGSGFTHDHLKKVEMQGFRGRLYEMEFAICILKHVRKLETMVLDPCAKFYEGDGKWENVPNSNPKAWKKVGSKVVQEKLKDVKTDARIVIL